MPSMQDRSNINHLDAKKYKIIRNIKVTIYTCRMSWKNGCMCVCVCNAYIQNTMCVYMHINVKIYNRVYNDIKS